MPEEHLADNAAYAPHIDGRTICPQTEKQLRRAIPTRDNAVCILLKSRRLLMSPIDASGIHDLPCVYQSLYLDSLSSVLDQSLQFAKRHYPIEASWRLSCLDAVFCSGECSMSDVTD